jgi:hypothetical protein
MFWRASACPARSPGEAVPVRFFPVSNGRLHIWRSARIGHRLGCALMTQALIAEFDNAVF